jgi:hypothetical protein
MRGYQCRFGGTVTLWLTTSVCATTLHVVFLFLSDLVSSLLNAFGRLSAWTGTYFLLCCGVFGFFSFFVFCPFFVCDVLCDIM